MDCIKFIYSYSEDFKIRDIKKLNEAIELNISEDSDLREYRFSTIKNTQECEIVYPDTSITVIEYDENYAKTVSNFINKGYIDIIFIEEFGEIFGYRISKNNVEHLKFLAFPESMSSECFNSGTPVIL